MAIIFRCACGRELRAKSDLAGKRTKCPECHATLTIPNPEPAPVAAKPVETGHKAAMLAEAPIAIDDDDDYLPARDPARTAARAEAPAPPPSSVSLTPIPESALNLKPAEIPHPEGCRRYKVLTPKDMGFIARFDAERLEARLNELARDGWAVRSTVTVKLPGPTGVHDELIMILEK